MDDDVEELEEILEVLTDLLLDPSVPKNVKTKIQTMIDALEEDIEISLRVNKALSILDEISDDNNLQSYTRTQIWNIASMLESLS